MSVPANVSAGRQVFRVAALQRHGARSEATVLPALGQPRPQRLLYLTLALLTWLVVIGAMTEIPVIIKGQAAVGPAAGAARCPSGRVCVVLFIPPDDGARLRIGLRVALSTDRGDAGLGGTVVEVQPGVLSPREARRRFALDPAVAGQLNLPRVAVLATLDPSPGGVPAEQLAGALLPASVSLGKRPLFRFVDGLGPPSGGRP